MEQPLQVLRRHWRVGLAALLICLAAALALSLTATKQYTARASLYFSVTSGNSGTELNQGAQYVLAQMPSYQQLATSSLVFGRANQSLGDQALVPGQVAASFPAGTTVLDITATTTDPTRSARAANAVASEMKLLATQISPVAASGKVLLSLETVRTALPPKVPSAPRKTRIVLGGLASGLIAAGLLSYMLEFLESRAAAHEADRALRDRAESGLQDHESLSREPA